MTIFGILVMIIGLALHFLPANDAGVINFGVQFLATTLSICGAIIFVGGFLQENLIQIRKALEKSEPASPPVEAKIEHSEPVPEGLVLASEYAKSIEESSTTVVEKIASGDLEGCQHNGRWYVKA